MTDLPYTGTITEGGLYTAPAAPHENNAFGTVVFAEIKYGSSNYGYGDAHVKFE
jgi:prepilin-type processing-associated H-X9-DG protein